MGHASTKPEKLSAAAIKDASEWYNNLDLPAVIADDAELKRSIHDETHLLAGRSFVLLNVYDNGRGPLNMYLNFEDNQTNPAHDQQWWPANGTGALRATKSKLEDAAVFTLVAVPSKPNEYCLRSKHKGKAGWLAFESAESHYVFLRDVPQSRAITFEFVQRDNNNNNNCPGEQYLMINTSGKWSRYLAFTSSGHWVRCAYENEGDASRFKLAEGSTSDEASAFVEASQLHSEQELVAWLTGAAPHSPASEAVALVRCCQTALGGKRHEQLQALFMRMYHASCGASQQEEDKLIEQGKVKNAVEQDGPAGVTKVAVRFAVKMMLQTGADGGALQMLLEEITASKLGQLSLCGEDPPEMLLAACDAAAEVCLHALKEATGRSMAAAHILLQLALQSGSVRYVVAVANWLLNDDSKASWLKSNTDSLDLMWKVTEELNSTRAPWSVQFLMVTSWEKAIKKGKHPSAMRSQTPLPAAAEIGPEGVYAEVVLVRDAAECLVCLVPQGSDAVEKGVGLSGSGESWCTSSGDASPYAPFTDVLADGDVVGVLLLNAAVLVFVNGRSCGTLPRFDDIFVHGCHLVVSRLRKVTEVVLNVGQAPFAFPPEDAADWASATGQEVFSKLKKRMCMSSVDPLQDRVAVACCLLNTLGRNQAQLEICSTQSVTYESPHPYHPNMDTNVEMKFPGAKKLKIHFDPQCVTEPNCDVLRFYKEEGRRGEVGGFYMGAFSSSPWQPFEFEGSSLWYHFHSDGSGEYWGFKFTVTPEGFDNRNVPLCLQEGPEMLGTLAELMQSPGLAQGPVAAISGLLDILPNHLETASDVEPEISNTIRMFLVKLIEKKEDSNGDESEIAERAGMAFQHCCTSLFSVLDLLKLQLSVWKSANKYYPKAKQCIEKALVTCKKPYGPIIDDPTSAAPVLEALCEFALTEGTESQDKAVRVLRRVLCDAILHVIAKPSADSWRLIFRIVQVILAPLENTSGSTESSSILALLALPLLHGLAAVSSWDTMPWDVLAALLSPLGAIVRKTDVAAVGMSGELRSAALVLLAVLGQAMVQLGSASCALKPEDDLEIALRSPLVRTIPSSALPREKREPPAGIALVEEMLQFKLLDGLEDKQLKFIEASPPVTTSAMKESMQEFVQCETTRAQALVDDLIKKVGPGRYHKVLSERIQRLLFCVLAKQFGLDATLQQMLHASVKDNEMAKLLPQLWVQADQLKMWLMSMEQRLSAQGRKKEQIRKDIDQTLEFVLFCGQAGCVSTDAIVDDNSMEVLLERQSSHVGLNAASPEDSIVVDETHGVQVVRRMRLLMKKLPTSSQQAHSSPSSSIHCLFEGKWFGADAPLEDLVQGAIAMSIAAWHSAAGMSLLSWVVEQCAIGADARATGVAVYALSEAWQHDAATELRSTEANASLALCGARSRAVKALVTLANARKMQDVGGLTTKVMAISALSGPWRSDDHHLILDHGVLVAIEPHLPWHQDCLADLTDAEKMLTQAAALSFHSFATLASYAVDGSSQLTPLARTSFQGQLEKLLEMKGSERASGASAPMLTEVFGATAFKPREIDGPVADLRKRLKAGQDFGGLEHQDFEPFLSTVGGVFTKLLKGKTARSVQAMDADRNIDRREEAEAEAEAAAQQSWADFDINGDGQIDEYELLRWALKQHVEGNLTGTSWTALHKTSVGEEENDEIPASVTGTQGYSESEFMEGQRQFTDRDFVMTKVMPDLLGTTLFQGPCHHNCGDVIIVAGPPTSAAYVCVGLGNEANEKDAMDSLLSDWECILDENMATQSFRQGGFRAYWKVIGPGLCLTLNTHVELSVAVGAPPNSLAYDISACRRTCESNGWGGFIRSHGKLVFLTASAADIRSKINQEGQEESTLHLCSIDSTNTISFPAYLPPGYPRFAGDGEMETCIEFSKLPTPMSLYSPCWALLVSLDRFVRSHAHVNLFTMAAKKHIEALIGLATQENASSVSAVLALRLLQRAASIDPVLASAATERLLASNANGSGAELHGYTIMVQRERARLVREWLDNPITAPMVNELLTAAIEGKDAVHQLAAMRVVASPAQLRSLGPSLIDGDCLCTVVAAEPPNEQQWELIRGEISPGGDLEHVDEFDVETLKQLCIEKGGVAFTLDGWIKESILPRSEWQRSENSPGTWICHVANIYDCPAVIIRDGSKCLETVSSGALQPLPEQCHHTQLTSAVREAVVRASAKLGLSKTCALTVVLQDKDAVKLLHSEELVPRWLRLAVTPVQINALAGMSRSQCNQVSSVVRRQYAKEFDAEAEKQEKAVCSTDASVAATGTAAPVAVDKDEEEAARIVTQAARHLGASDDLIKDLGKGSPTVSQMLRLSASILQSPSGVCVMPPRTKPKKEKKKQNEDTGGMVDQLPNEKSDEKGEAVCKYLRETPSSDVVRETVLCEQQSFSLDVMLAVLLGLCPESGFEKGLGSPEEFVQLYFKMWSRLETNEKQDKARKAMIAIATLWPSLVDALKVLTLAHLLGSLDLKAETVSMEYESPHPYLPCADDVQEVTVPGAKRLIINFDPECYTEHGYDQLKFLVEGQVVATKTGRGPWEPITIESNAFVHHFTSDGGTEFWGYKFTVTAEGVPPKKSNLPCLDQGLWLMEFLLDLQIHHDDQAATILRPEFAAVLLSYAEQGNHKAPKLIQRFADSCTKHNVTLDWSPACVLLQTMIKRAQKEKHAASLQDFVGLRLSLPQVRIEAEPPRFVPTAGVLLIDNGVSCFAKSGGTGPLFCRVATTDSSVSFFCTNQQDAWVGVVPEGSSWADDCRMIRLKDGAECAGLGNIISDSSVALQEVRVTLDAKKVSFDADGLSSSAVLPSGKWEFAACLCDSGAKVRVLPANNMSDTSLKKHCLAKDALGAVVKNVDWPDEFASEIFAEWWKAKKFEPKDIWSKMCQTLVVSAESHHPVSFEKRQTTKISIPDAECLTLNFSEDSQLPPGSVILVTLDEAGKKAAPIKQQTGVSNTTGAVISVSGQTVEVDASECFIHCPMPRPLSWDALDDRIMEAETLKLLRPARFDPLSDGASKWITMGIPEFMQDAGKYYYEVKIGRGTSYPQLGWLTDKFEIYVDIDRIGVGDNDEGWGMDGQRMTLWHAGPMRSTSEGHVLSEKWSRYWEDGDVIGLAIDIDNCMMQFTMDGSWDSSINHKFEAAGRKFYPAVSQCGHFELLIPSSAWKYSPPRKEFKAWADVGTFERPTPPTPQAGDLLMCEVTGSPIAQANGIYQLEPNANPKNRWKNHGCYRKIDSNRTLYADSEGNWCLGQNYRYNDTGGGSCGNLYDNCNEFPWLNSFPGGIKVTQIIPETPTTESTTDAAVDGFQLGGDATLLFTGEQERNAGDFLVHLSSSALNSLGSNVIAGEISVDFMAADTSCGNLAVGITTKKPLKMQWSALEVPSATDENVSETTSKEEKAQARDPDEKVATLMDMGYPKDAVLNALRRANGSLEEAANFLMENPYVQVPDDERAKVSKQKDKGEQPKHGQESEAAAWWWRCDGSTRDCGNASPANEGSTFGAGDTLTLLATISAARLRKVECRRNGKIMSAMILPGEGLLLPESDTNYFGLSVAVAVRSTMTCVSLLPYPHYYKPANQQQQMTPLTDEEEILARNIFAALDANSDGMLDKTEIAAALGACRKDFFDALDQDASGQVSIEEWLTFLKQINKGNDSSGLQLFLESFRKKLAHIGKAVVTQGGSKREAWGYTVKATPRGFAAGALARFAREHMASDWAKFVSLACEGWTPEANECLMSLVNWCAKQKGKTLVDPTTLVIPDLTSNKQKRNKELCEATRAVIESDDRVVARFLAVQALNRMVKDDIFPFCDFARLCESPSGRVLLEARSILFSGIKRADFQKIIDNSFTNTRGGLQINRGPASQCSDTGVCDEGGEKMLFAQASIIAAKSFNSSIYRAMDRAFEVKYTGEDGVDAGGLYRDFFTAISAELMSKQLPVLVPTANGRANTGDHRDAWTVSPVPITSAIKRMLCFLGQLMGLCVRRGDVLPLALSQLTWKLLVGESTDLEDLEAMDIAAAESAKNLGNVNALGITSDEFECTFGEIYFTQHNSADLDVPLVPGGECKKVTFENAAHFAEKLIEMRLTEAKEQVALIRAGMATVIPVNYLSLWSWYELQCAVCGSPEVDIEMLKKKVHYKSCSATEDRVKFLWQALEEMSQTDRQNFLQFCWGRSRLPPVEDHPQWGDGFIITGASNLPRDGMPMAHTCFFQIDMPAYSSYEICNARVLYAIRQCKSMQNS